MAADSRLVPEGVGEVRLGRARGAGQGGGGVVGGGFRGGSGFEAEAEAESLHDKAGSGGRSEGRRNNVGLLLRLHLAETDKPDQSAKVDSAN